MCLEVAKYIPHYYLSINTQDIHINLAPFIFYHPTYLCVGKGRESFTATHYQSIRSLKKVVLLKIGTSACIYFIMQTGTYFQFHVFGNKMLLQNFGGIVYSRIGELYSTYRE